MSSIFKGKQQILFNYLPGKTFDFGKSIIARIKSIRGYIYHDLNSSLVVRKVNEHAQAWSESFRPALRNALLADKSRFVLLDPKQVTAEFFPKVFWCSEKTCNKVYDFTNSNNIPLQSKTCPRCKKGKLNQLRFIKIHRCGHIEPLTPPKCEKCHSANMALDTRESVRISNFRWKCLDCQNVQTKFEGKCFKCTWPVQDGKLERLDIEVFRSSKTYYVHSATLINIPQNDYDIFFRNEEWHVISTAKFLDLQQLHGFKTYEFANNIHIQVQGGNMISSDDLGILLERLNRGEISQAEFIAETLKLKDKKNPTIDDLKNEIVKITGLTDDYWKDAKYDVLDTIVPFEIGSYKQIEQNSTADQKARGMGIQKLSLLNDFPIIIAAYGFSRADHSPNLCFLNPFPIDREHNGRIPIYVDKINADAVCFNLNYEQVIGWLRENGFIPIVPNATSESFSAKAYFINLFRNINVSEKLFQDNPEAKMVMGLLHTYSHLAIKHAALLCGLDKTSLAEYVIPKTLTFVIYCNHRFGATLGALTSLFEQSLLEWLTQIEVERKCVYDPVCYDKGGNCHSCTHLAETSCRFFNLNLGRVYLFGGFEPELNREIKGFIDFIS